MDRRQFCALTGATLLAPAAFAQAPTGFPTKPIRIVVPTPPGGPLDTLARMMSEKMTTTWGQPVVVDNRSGANGSIAYAAVANAPPDGHTFVLSLSSLVQATLLMKAPPYRLEQLAAVTIVATMPNAFAVGSHVPVTTMAQFLAWAKSRTDGVDYGSSGPGSSGNIMGATLAKDANINLVHVPFRGDVPGMQALLGGQIASLFGVPGNLAQYAQTGKVRLLALAAPKRLKDFPDVPTFAELGFPRVNLAGWSMVAVPAGTPQPIVDQLSAEIARIVQTPEVSARIASYGFQPEGTNAEAGRKLLREEGPRWSAAMQVAGVTPE
ncbi:tripartite tricarboxylate transporter substrate binding protein [Hydrogenophaga sp.]|uniref:Bug family tripartite tricarboxylate transporter substrate binding protein n=1 Tax=Hydrogenophaga sp. TaxID=1904254 RepID=UPI002718A8CE|nr:tripartite tricarboxylate transporter substrate binding protein [Hydrogenophaga sp.]MDO9436550.1 tripartite tricarboxylate transporter substrate binding protein [Hydrogenophaga sp.]